MLTADAANEDTLFATADLYVQTAIFRNVTRTFGP